MAVEDFARQKGMDCAVEVAVMRVLVVYYSRTGITEKSCRAVAEALKAADESVEVEVEEIVDKTDRSGVLGYLGGGKDALLSKPTEIEPVEADVGAFDLVVIGTPVWAARCAPAVREFCQQFAEQLDTVAFVATMGGRGDTGAYKEMSKLTGREPVTTLTLIDRRVRAEDGEEFRAKVEEFARRLAGQP
ncbi:MAG: flavodoxin family protein [Armatimonadota bacterium]